MSEMAAIGEPGLRWWAAEKAEVRTPDLAALIPAYSGLLYRVVFSILRDPAEAEDVVQDAFLRVLERPAALAEVREFRPWLVRIAWNLALDRRRRRRPQQMDAVFAATLSGHSIPADQALADMQQMATVLREMDRLPETERHVLLLSAFDELGTAEIAAVLGRSESAVRALLFRGRKRLRERLQRRPQV